MANDPTQARPVPKKNVACHLGFPILDADGDLVSGATGLDSEVSTQSGGFADATEEAVEETTSSGMYEITLTAGEMNGDIVMVIAKSTQGKTTPIVMYPEEAGDIRVDVTQISGDATAADNAELFYDGTGYAAANSTVGTVTAVTTVNGLAANVITAAAINNGAIDAATFAAGAIDAAALAADAVAEIADGVWDEAMAGHLTLGTYGQQARAHGLSGEVNDVAPTTTSFAVDGFTEATADHFNGMVMVFTSGALLGQARVITDYAVTTQIVTLAEALTEAPADNDDFVIVPGAFLGGVLAQVFRLFITILNASTGQLDAGSLTADTIDAAALAAGAVDEFWDEAMTESAGIPAVTASFRDGVRWIFALSRNKITQTSTTQALRNDADAANIATSAVSDDGTTAIRNEWA